MKSWTFATLVAATLACLLHAAPAVAEYDSLTGFKVKDPTSFLVGPVVTVDDVMTAFSNTPRGCILGKKAAWLLSPAETGGGDDDPRGGPVAGFICFKVKCDGDAEIAIPTRDTIFGTFDLTTKKTSLVCVPAPPAS